MARIDIEGIALYSGYSLNGYYFTLESLMDGDGEEVDLYLEHDYSKLIGKVKFIFDRDDAMLKFKGYIDYDSLSQSLKEEVNEHLNGGAKVSVGCEVLEYSILTNVNNIEDRINECILITHVKFYELSIVMNPSFPLTTISTNAKVIKVDNMATNMVKDRDKTKMIDLITCSITTINTNTSTPTPTNTPTTNMNLNDMNLTNMNLTYNMEGKPTLQENHNINMEDERIVALKNYLARRVNHIKFSINAIDATPFNTRSEMGVAPRPTIVSGNVEEFLNKGVVEGKKATWVVVPIVEWSSFVDGSTPNDATQAISEVEEVVGYRGYRQGVSDLAKLVAPIDLVGELIRLEKSMVAYEIDKEIFAKRSGASTIVEEDAPFSYTHLLNAIRTIRANGGVGEIVALLPPKAFHELLSELHASTYGDNTPFANKDGIYEVYVFGARVRMTSREVIDNVGGTNYLRSIIFLSGSIGVALGDLEVEVFRDGNALKDVITIKKAFALKYLNPMHIVVLGTQA
ncbi:MAG: hypothetical protein QXK74_08385 [Candidatus Nitrosocaldaceae archaeon]